MNPRTEDHPTSLPFGMTRSQWRVSLAAAVSSLTAAVFTFGFSAPLLNLLLERQGVPSGLIGANAAMGTAAALLITPFLPRIAGRLGTMNTLMLGIVIMVGCLIALAAFRDVRVWMVLRFLMGAGAAAHWVISEIWINTLATGPTRGRIMGVYVTCLAASYGAGPLVLSYVGIDGWTPFVIAASAVLLAAVPILTATRLAPNLPRHPPIGFVAAFQRAPITMLSALVDGTLNAVLFNMLPLYAVRSGFTEEMATRLVALKIFGSVLTQYYIGTLADRYDARSLLMLTAAIAMVGAILLPFCIGVPALIWPLALVWGGLMSGMYTIGLTQLGRRFEPLEMSSANALFVMMHMSGGIAGPVAAGVGMQLWNPHGMLGTVVIAAGVFIVAVLARKLHERAE